LLTVILCKFNQDPCGPSARQEPESTAPVQEKLSKTLLMKQFALTTACTGLLEYEASSGVLAYDSAWNTQFTRKHSSGTGSDMPLLMT
jgi:hypothetical protein